LLLIMNFWHRVTFNIIDSILGLFSLVYPFEKFFGLCIYVSVSASMASQFCLFLFISADSMLSFCDFSFARPISLICYVLPISVFMHCFLWFFHYNYIIIMPISLSSAFCFTVTVFPSLKLWYSFHLFVCFCSNSFIPSIRICTLIMTSCYFYLKLFCLCICNFVELSLSNWRLQKTLTFWHLICLHELQRMLQVDSLDNIIIIKIVLQIICMHARAVIMIMS
jgi:hypothetical protein